MVNHLRVKGTYNIRDLGDYPIGNHEITASRVLIRAGNLDQLPRSSQQQLIKYGVKTVIDLRDEWEVARFPNVFAQSKTIQYLNLPLIGNDLSHNDTWKAQTEDYDYLHELYNKYLDSCQAQIGAIITAIAESLPTIIFQCYAGKDRTGIIAALLLGLVDVPDHLIAEDYSLSNHQITHLIKQWREYAVEHGQDMERLERDISSETITMLSMLNHIKLQYGNVPDYLRVCGVTSSQLARIRSFLIQAET